MLPNYFQPHDIEDRLKRKVVYFSSNKIPLTFGPTVDPKWWSIIQVNEVFGERILNSLMEVRVRDEDDPKYMRDAMREYCELMHIPWADMLQDETVPRINRNDPLAEERDAAKIALMRWSQSQH